MCSDEASHKCRCRICIFLLGPSYTRCVQLGHGTHKYICVVRKSFARVKSRKISTHKKKKVQVSKNVSRSRVCTFWLYRLKVFFLLLLLEALNPISEEFSWRRCHFLLSIIDSGCPNTLYYGWNIQNKSKKVCEPHRLMLTWHIYMFDYDVWKNVRFVFA